MRLTLLTAKTDFAVGESIHALHVLDVSVPGRGVYVMGPKVPTGEYLDGNLATGAPEIPFLHTLRMVPGGYAICGLAGRQ